jgi:hypothetical protein
MQDDWESEYAQDMDVFEELNQSTSDSQVFSNKLGNADMFLKTPLKRKVNINGPSSPGTFTSPSFSMNQPTPVPSDFTIIKQKKQRFLVDSERDISTPFKNNTIQHSLIFDSDEFEPDTEQLSKSRYYEKNHQKRSNELFNHLKINYLDFPKKLRKSATCLQTLKF